MKRILVLVVAMLLVGLALTSCTTSSSCPAYNTYDQYQMEQMY